MLAIGSCPMAELITTLRDSRDVYSEKLRQLLLNFQKFPNALYCVYEGEDAKYYGIRVDTFSGADDRRKVPCKGKDDVLKLFGRVASDERLMHSNTIFFIDRDFDGLKGSQGGQMLYMTPCYSIENLYIQDGVLRRILIEEFGVDDFGCEKELVRILDLYNKLFDELASALTTLNAWIFLQRSKENPGSKINLNNKKLNRFVSISLDKVEKLYTKEDLVTLFPEAVEILDEELSAKEEEFSRCDKSNVYRGKYFVEFLRIFLDLLKADRQCSSPRYFDQKQNVKLTLSRANILSELSQYADTPECLKTFLQRLRSSF